MTVEELITASLQELGILGPTDVPSADDAATGFNRLNDWIDALKTEGLTVYTVTRTTWTITGASSYTVGTGGAINIDRPVNADAIEDIGYQNTAVSPLLELTFGGALDQHAYEALPYKTQTAVYPTSFYYNPTYPLGTLTPWPVPTATTLQGVIYAPTPVSEFAALSTAVGLPPGYRRFLRTNLALELAPVFGITPVSLELQDAARQSKGAIKRINERLTDLITTGAGWYDIVTDTTR